MTCIKFKRVLIIQSRLFNIIDVSLVLRVEPTAKVREQSSKSSRYLNFGDRGMVFHKECRSDMETFLM